MNKIFKNQCALKNSIFDRPCTTDVNDYKPGPHNMINNF